MTSPSPSLPRTPRTALAVAAAVALMGPTSAQATWTRQAHVPTWKNCLSISAPADDRFFASAGALFAQEGDVLDNLGGTHEDWTTTALSNTTLNAIHFLDPQHGWAAGNGMFHTTDGGQSWVQDNTWGSIYDLHFVDPLRGWAAGNGGIVYRTSDGGHTWSGVFAALSGFTARSVWFLDAQNGWAAGIGGHLSQSTDGGASWTNRYAGSYLTGVQFFDAQEGWGMGGDTFVHTTDGGATWTTVPLPAGSWIQAGRFFDRMRGVAVGDGGNVVRTTDGGLTWSTVRPSGSGPRLWDVEFSPGGVAVASGDRGYMLRSDDFGATWTPLSSGASWTTRGLDAVDRDHAWSANEAGEIGLTTDGGRLWERVTVAGFDDFGDLYDVDFHDRDHGWAVGQQQVFGLADDGRISRSTDGGRTWTLQFSQSALEFFGVTALDADSAIAYGRGNFANSAYLRTDDGGATWTGAGSPAAIGTFRDACFLPGGQVGWLVGDSIWHTTDGGQSWAIQYNGSGGPNLASVSFADGAHGWVSGFGRTLLRTTDGGSTWTPQDPGGPAGAAYMSVAATGPDSAVVVGWSGFVARTRDGGLTWTTEVLPDVPNLAAATEWNAAVFLEDDHGWIGGNAGIQFHGRTTVGTAVCFGDGSAIPCPCGNTVPAGTASGCRNATGEGASLTATGSDRVVDDALVLRVEGLPPATPGLFVQGRGSALQPLQDGLLCVGGAIVRLDLVFADGAGVARSTGPLAALGGIAPGDSVRYQFWYRDPGGAASCNTGANLTNAVLVPWR